MNMRTVFLMVVVVSLSLIGYFLFRLFKLLNSPDGERTMRRRMQGPLVPPGEKEHAQDKARRLEARRKKPIR